MPTSRQAKSKTDTVQRTQYVYRGRNIEVRKDDKRTRLFIDGQEVEMEQTEGGVISHSFMYKEFGTPFELAEELVKQWGEARIEHASKPPDQPHH